MASQIHADVDATRTPQRLSSANYLLYIVIGMVLLGTIATGFQDASSQTQPWLILLGPTICCLGAYVIRLESRIAGLESQMDRRQSMDDA